MNNGSNIRSFLLVLIHVHDVNGDVQRKKERHLSNGELKMKVASGGIQTRHSVLQTDALPTELPRQPSWQGLIYIYIVIVMSLVNKQNYIYSVKLD